MSMKIARHTCVTCSDKNTCQHPDYGKKVTILIKTKYFKGEPIVCKAWRPSPDKAEFKKWRFDEKVRFAKKNKRPDYSEIMLEDKEFMEWAYRLSKPYIFTEKDIEFINNKIRNIHPCYELSKKVPILRYRAINDRGAYYYSVLMEEYLDRILKIRLCRECNKLTRRPKYCSKKCATRARVRRHRQSSK